MTIDIKRRFHQQPQINLDVSFSERLVYTSCELHVAKPALDMDSMNCASPLGHRRAGAFTPSPTTGFDVVSNLLRQRKEDVMYVMR